MLESWGVFKEIDYLELMVRKLRVLMEQGLGLISILAEINVQTG